MPLPPGFCFTRALTAGLLVVRALGLLRTDTEVLADELDVEAERNHPVHESFVNPAKSIALRLADRTPLLWGLDDVATAVAARAAATLAGFGGVVCDAAGYSQAATRTALHRAALRAGSGTDIFADPDEQPLEGAGTPLRVQLLAVRQGPEVQAARQTALDAPEGADPLNRAFRAVVRSLLEAGGAPGPTLASLASRTLCRTAERRLTADGWDERQVRLLIDLEPGSPDDWLAYLILSSREQIEPLLGPAGPHGA